MALDNKHQTPDEDVIHSTLEVIHSALEAYRRARYTADRTSDLYPATITNYAALTAIVNENGGNLKDTEKELGITFTDYATFDTDKDGIIDSYIMSFRVNELLDTDSCLLIAISPEAVIGRGEERCKLHKSPLKPGTAKIVYGLCLTIFDEELAGLNEGYVEKEFFPLSHSTVGGGCLVSRQEEQPVLYCEACRKAERAWIHMPKKERCYEILRNLRKKIEEVNKLPSHTQNQQIILQAKKDRMKALEARLQEFVQG